MTYTAPVESVAPDAPAGQLLRRVWQPVFVARNLQPGKPVPLRVLGEELTLYRGESGRPYIVGARCPHRYTWLHTGFVEGEEIRCFYHGWKFDGVGQCTDQPAEKSSFAAKVRIPSYPAREYGGLVFAWMGTGDPPELPRIPELDADGVRVVAGIRPPGLWPVNYFQILENNVDPVHTSFVHKATEPHWGEIPEVTAKETEYGLEVTATRSGVPRRTRFHFPNLMHITIWLISDEEVEFDHFFWTVPVDDEHSMFVSATVIPEALADRVPRAMAGRVMPDGAHMELMTGARRPESITEEDYVAMVGQGTVADRTNERLGRSDVAVVKLRKLWANAIEQLEPRPPGTPTPGRDDRRPRVRREN